MTNYKSQVARWILAAVASVTMLVGAPLPSQAQSGTVRLKIVKVGFIVGVGGGDGALSYQGKTYPLSIGGVSVGTLGVATVNLVGTATNLRRPSDIAGTYGAAGAGAAFGPGAQVATLQNEKGVVLKLKGAQAGFELSAGLAGLTISLK